MIYKTTKLFSYTSSKIIFPLTAFFKEIIIKTKQQFYILNILLGQTKYIMQNN